MSYTNGLDKPSDYFNTLLWNGNNSGTTREITGVGFTPDFIWSKRRGTSGSHQLYDTIRGTQNVLQTDSTTAQITSNVYGAITTLGSDGYTWTNGSDGANPRYYFNESDTYCSWNWKAGGTAASNTDGSITSTVSANTTAGFSIVKYTSTGTTNSQIGHGLNATPTNVIIKCTSDAATSWISKMKGADGYVYLDQTYALTSNSTWLPTSSSTITLTNTWGAYNTSGRTYIAYCFAEKKGFSKFGSYTGNGSSDGTFVYTGGKPSWLMVKRTDSVQGWYILDNKRNTFNPEDKYLEANDSDAEATFTFCDFLSGGFKARVDNTGTGFNASGGSYIYMCFNENPFVTSTGVPTTAR